MPSQREVVRIHGLATLQRAFKRFGSEEAKGLDREIRAGGAIVVNEARNRFSAIETIPDAIPGRFVSQAPGFARLVVRRSRSRGVRGDFGELLMLRVLLPARSEAYDSVVEHIDGMLGRLAGEEF